MPEWRTERLSDVVELRRGFDLPHRDRVPGPFPVLSAGITAGWHNEGPIKGPGFAVGRATNLGVPTWSDRDFWPLNTTLYAADFKGNHPRFLFHIFELVDLSGFDSGSVQPMLNRNYIARVPVRVPDLPTQQAIAEVLGALDDKIAANTNVLVAIEALMLATAQRAESRALLGALAEHNTTSIKPAAFSDLVAHFSLPAFDNGAWPENAARDDVQSNKFLLRGPSVLVAKLNPRIPRIWDIPVLADRTAVASTEFVVLEPAECSTSALWASVKQADFSTQLQGKVAGTSGSHQRVRPADMLAAEVLDPRTLSAADTALLNDLGMTSYFTRMESSQLAATRDQLLPLLMSGRITVRDAEAMV